MGPKTDDGNASFKSLKLFPHIHLTLTANSQTDFWKRRCVFFYKNTHRKWSLLILCVSRFQTQVGRSNHKNRQLWEPKKHVFTFTMQAAPVASWQCCLPLWVNSHPEVWQAAPALLVFVLDMYHLLCILYAAWQLPSSLARICGRWGCGGTLCCLFHCFILSNQ